MAYTDGLVYHRPQTNSLPRSSYLPHQRVGRCYFRHAGDIVNAPFSVPISYPTMNADNQDAEDNFVTAQTDPPVTTQETADNKLSQMITCGTQTDACDTDDTSTQTIHGTLLTRRPRQTRLKSLTLVILVPKQLIRTLLTPRLRQSRLTISMLVPRQNRRMN